MSSVYPSNNQSECGCIFEPEFQTRTDNAPQCPLSGTIMNSQSWKHLRSIMAEINDFNTDIIKWHSDLNEPLMQVSGITVRTLKEDYALQDVVLQ